MKSALRHPLFLSVALTFLAGCASTPRPAAPTSSSLNADNTNLAFVISEDLKNNASGDVDPTTANLTSQGLQRSLRMASFLRKNVLGDHDATGIYALEPMTHLQTADLFPDMRPLTQMVLHRPVELARLYRQVNSTR